MVSLIQKIQGIPEAFRINLPAPVACLHIRILRRVQSEERLPAVFHFRTADGIAHVIAESNVIHAAFFQAGKVFLCHVQSHIVLSAERLHIRRILSEYMQVAVIIQPVFHGSQSSQLILRRTGPRIERYHGKHAADLEIRIDLMPQLHDSGACDHLVMDCLLKHCLDILVLFVTDSGIGPCSPSVFHISLIVDLIKGHPVFYLVPVTPHHCFGKTDKEIDQLPAAPSAVFRYQMVGHLKMA